MSMYRRFDKNNCMYFLINKEKCFDKYNEILGKVSNIMNKIFNSELI